MALYITWLFPEVIYALINKEMYILRTSQKCCFHPSSLEDEFIWVKTKWSYKDRYAQFEFIGEI